MNNDRHPSASRLQQESIMNNLIAKSAKTCLDCGATTKLWALAKHPGCTGQVCSCGWQGLPEFTLGPDGLAMRVEVVGGDVR